MGNSTSFKPGESGNPGGRPKNVQRYDYWLQVFKDMSKKQFDSYTTDRPEDDMYMAEYQAYLYFKKVINDNYVWNNVADRTEGKAQQKIDHTSNGETIKGAIFAFEDNPEPED